LDDYIKYLKKTFHNKIYLYSKGEDKISLIIQPFKTNDNIRYKFDVFRTEPENYYSMLLYSTGPRDFNIRQRRHAKKLGLLLNQNGIFKNGKKINSSGDTERDLFKILNMDYVEPKDRK
jgi:DNA polymerase/3'-5' exonuclease PolX